MKDLINQIAEDTVISGLLADPETNFIQARSENITEKHFLSYRAGQIFAIISKMYDEGNCYFIQDLAMSDTVKTIKASDANIAHDITQIESLYQGGSHWQSYLTPLKRAKATRDAHRAATTAIRAIESGEETSAVADILRTGGEETILAMESRTAWKDANEATKEFVYEFETLCSPDGEIGIATGIPELDRLTGGMRDGTLWVISGETSAGKTVGALQLAANAITLGKQTAIFSLEMTASENVARVISNLYKVHYGALRNPGEKRYDAGLKKFISLTTREKSQVGTASKVMRESTFRIVDEGGLTIERIEAICKEMNERKPLELIIIDYVQLVTTTRKGFATHEELGWLVARMKQLAKTYSCPVVTASQLNDNGQLAQSRAIGHHADVVMRIEGEKGIYLFKNRNGKRFVHVPLELIGEYQRFAEFDPNRR